MQIDQFQHDDNYQRCCHEYCQQNYGKVSRLCLEAKAYPVRAFANQAHEILLALERFEVMGQRAHGTA